jgi:hypothetical protein
MFRIQRELWVQENYPSWPNWLAWSDYLILASVVLFFAVMPLVAISPMGSTEAFASAACVAALMQVGYIPAILAHYRIEIDTRRTGYASVSFTTTTRSICPLTTP